MKKILFSLLVLVGITATAQVKVGSNPTTIDTGTTNFQVEGTTTADQFVVLKNGNVGIGTTTPTAKLSVSGVIDNTSNVISTGNIAGNVFHGIVNTNTSTNAASLLTFGNSSNSNGASIILAGTNFPFFGGANSLNLVNNFDAPTTFWTNNTQRATILGNGNLGIGTATPSQKLHVEGGALVSALAGTGSRMVVADATGVLSTQSIPTGNAGTVTSVTGSAPLSVATGTTTPVISIATANTSTTGALTGADWTTFNNKIGSATNGLTASAGNVKLGGALIENTSLTGDFNFTIPGTGNVGIGTTTPTAKLSVSGVIDNTSNVISTGNIAGNLFHGIVNTNTGTSAASLLTLGNSANANAANLILGGSGFTAYGGANSLNLVNSLNAPTTFWTNNTQRATILGNGNVGISTTTPTSKLEVAGAVATVVSNTAASITLTEANSTVTVDLTAAALTVTLPEASTCNGRIYNISRTDATTNVLTFSLPISIGSTTFTTSNIPGANFSIQSNGSNWRLINN